jgi:hypothetical protein
MGDYCVVTMDDGVYLIVRDAYPPSHQKLWPPFMGPRLWFEVKKRHARLARHDDRPSGG